MSTTNRLWQVVAAAGLALLAVLLTTFYVTNYKHNVQHAQAQVTVLVAAKDIPIDTQGSELRSGASLTKESVPRREVVPGAISNPTQLQNLIATEPIYAGEQVTTRRFGTPSERGVRAQIKGTQRAIEVEGDAHQLLAGTLRTGDHVDVVGAWEKDDNARASHASSSRDVARARRARRARQVSGHPPGRRVLRAAEAHRRGLAEARMDLRARQELAARDPASGTVCQQPALVPERKPLLKDGAGTR